MKKIVETMLKIYSNNRRIVYQKSINVTFTSVNFLSIVMTFGSVAIFFAMKHYEMNQYYSSNTSDVGPNILLLMMGVIGYYMLNLIAVIICFNGILDEIKDWWFSTIGKVITNVKYKYYKIRSEKIKAEIKVNYRELIAEAKKHNCEKHLSNLMNGLSIQQNLDYYSLDKYDIKKLRKIGLYVKESEDVFSDVTYNSINIHSDDGSHANVVDDNISFFQKNAGS